MQFHRFVQDSNRIETQLRQCDKQCCQMDERANEYPTA
jgi:hypothetical protein